LPEKLKSIDFSTQPPAFKFFRDNGNYYLCMFPGGPTIATERAFRRTISHMHFQFKKLIIHSKF